MNDQKVVRITDKKGTTPVRLPSQLVQLHKQLQRFLHTRLTALFIAADSRFCELSDNGASNQECEQYFDIAQQLRKKRNSIAGRQFQLMREQFQQLAQAEAKNEEDGLRGIDAAPLGLLSEEQQEIDVAVRTMVSKRRHSEHQLDFEHLTTRIAALFNHGDVSASRNPMGAESLCDSFVGACEALEIPIRPRLMLFRLYEKHVLQDLGALHAEANELLKEQGVLPGLTGLSKPQSATPKSSPQPESSKGASAGVNNPAPQALMSSLQTLLKESSSDQPEPVDQGSQALVELVASVQAAQSQGILQAQGAGDTGSDRLSDLLQTVESLAQDDPGLELSSMERDVFKLVDLLFNYMTDDQQLPGHFKPLFNQLQLPILKTALIDRGFFTHADHPARMLLERLGKLSIGLDAKPQQDRLFRLLEEQINLLVNDASASSGQFEQVIGVINRFASREERRAALLEQRLKDAEEGLAKTEYARVQASKVLSELLLRYPAPSLVETLLHGGWQQYLLLCLLKQGERSEAWLQGVKTAEQLLWSLQPKRSTAECKKLLKLIPELRRALRHGLNTISFDSTGIHHFLVALDPLHKEVLRNGMSYKSDPKAVDTAVKAGSLDKAQVSVETTIEKVGAAPTPKVKPVKQSVAKAAVLPESRVESEDLPKFESVPVVSSPEDCVEVSKPEHLQAPTVQPALAMKITVEVNKPAAQETTKAASVIDGDWAERVDQLQPGVWVEFKAASGDFRAKLAAYLRPTDRFVFVNRNGAKVAEPSRQQLVEQLQQGEVKLLEDALLFDRALESIITSLRDPR